MNKKYLVLAFFLHSLILLGQQPLFNAYYPEDNSSKSWTSAAHIYYDHHNNSNYFTNEFSNTLNRSGYISQEEKNHQMDQIEGPVLSGRIQNAGMGAWFRKKDKKIFFYAGLDFQQIIDGQIDPDFLKLAFYGNKPYAGQKLQMENTTYQSSYFNRLKWGMGTYLSQGDIKHTLSAVVAFTVGQNYDYIKVNQASLFTHETGEYIDISIQAETQIADTIWGQLFSIKGLGASVDFHYSIQKEKDFFLALHLQNLGFIHWTQNPISATTDTSFTYEGINSNDGQGELPKPNTGNALIDLVFPNPSHTAFTKMLSLQIQLSGGKFINNGRFYLGANSVYYPTLLANYRAEIFATWYLFEKYQLTPIVGYSSYGKWDMGLAIGAQLWNSLSIHLGTNYLNSMFNPHAPVGQGGFVSLKYIY